ncbi:hypothetical protein MTR67_001105 [Solanum verrucosum]|uniref:Uncharacterized protein n=1 Tax=Solanum verrucosum TaxID=315347 RepID=A0AAF0TC36_SOLVR|nr:hypothetical protein MTR67_001105 [Solanum verrucosum]
MDVGESIIIGNCWKLPGNAAKEGYDGLEEVGSGIVNGGKGDWSGKGSFSISAISSAAGNMHARNLEFRPTERITIHSTYYYDTKMETCEDERSSLKRRLSAASVEIEKQRMKCFP